MSFFLIVFILLYLMNFEVHFFLHYPDRASKKIIFDKNSENIDAKELLEVTLSINFI